MFPSPCFTYIPIIIFTHLSSELFGLVRSGRICNRDPRTEENFQHSTARYTDSGGSNLWTPSGLVLYLKSSTYLYLYSRFVEQRTYTDAAGAAWDNVADELSMLLP